VKNSKRRIVYQAIAGLVAFQVLSNLLYLVFPFSLNPVEWNWLVLSSSTSFWGIYYALRAYWYAVSSVERMKREAEELVGAGLIRELLRVGKEVERRWERLSEEDRRRIVRTVERAVDGLFRLVERPERKTVRKIRAS